MYLAKTWPVLNSELMNLSQEKHRDTLPTRTPHFPSTSSREWKSQGSQSPFSQVLFIIVEFICHNLKIKIFELKHWIFSLFISIFSWLVVQKRFKNNTFFTRKAAKEWIDYGVLTRSHGHSSIPRTSVPSWYFPSLCKKTNWWNIRDLRSYISAISI